MKLANLKFISAFVFSCFILVYGFQNCAPIQSNFDGIGSPSLPLDNLAAFGGAGNGHGYDGKIYSETISCGTDSQKTRSQILVLNGVEAWMVSDECVEIPHKHIETESWRFEQLNGTEHLITSSGRIYVEGNFVPPSPPVLAANKVEAAVVPPVRIDVSEYGSCGKGYCACSAGKASADSICRRRGYAVAVAFQTAQGPLGYFQCNSSGTSCVKNNSLLNLICTTVQCGK